MKAKQLITTLLLLWGLGLEAQSPSTDRPVLYVFLAIDMSQPRRIPDRTKDKQAMEAFFRNIAQQAGMDVKVRHFSNDKLRANIIMNEIRGLRSFRGTRNSFVFYFSGHGGNWENNRFPNLLINNQRFPLTEIHKLVVDTLKPKVSIIMGDCCNNVISDNIELATQLPPPNAELIRRIFGNFGQPHQRLSVLITGASKGQYSFSKIDQGSVFRQCFVEAFRQETQSRTQNNEDTRDPETVWRAIINRSTTMTKQVLNRINITNQTPYGEIRFRTSPEEADR